MLAKELISDPFHDDEIPAVLLQIAAQLLAKAQQPKPDNNKSDRLLSIDEAAARLNVSRQWLYHRTKTLPFAVHNGRRLGFSEHGIDQYIAKNLNRGGRS